MLRGGALGVGGLVLGVSLLSGGEAAAVDGGAAQFAPDAFIRIGSDDSVTLVMSQTEMGQGIYTAIAMIIAEELDVSLDRVTLEAAPPNDGLYGNPIFKIQMTGGSTSVRSLWMPMRRTGAAARAMIVAAAARRWQVDPAACRTASGVVHHEPSGRSLTYGALVAQAARMPRPTDPQLKDPKDFTLVGSPVKRLDVAGKVDGSTVYGIDARPEGVGIATLACCPVEGGRILRVDDTQTKAVPGVRQVVILDDLVAVVADHMWAAIKGLEAMDVIWDLGVNADVSSASIWADLAAATGGTGVVAQTVGHPHDELGKDGLLEVAYELPLLAHAAMEPMNCTVHVRPGKCEVWVGTQVMTQAQRVIAKEAGLKPYQVTIHNHLIGGGFGRRLEVDGIAKAVRIAMHVEGPVKVVWTREEDIQKSMYRPVYHNRMRARLINGRPSVWNHRVVGPSILARFLPPAFVGGLDVDAVDGATDQPYDFPNVLVDYVRHEPRGVATCFWRGVGPNSNIFASESFMDRLAHEAGEDPVAFRRKLLGRSPRARAVLDLAVEKAGWGGALPGGSARGVCVQSAFGSFLAAVAQVAVGDDGDVKVERLVCAVDCGLVINPDTVAPRSRAAWSSA